MWDSTIRFRASAGWSTALLAATLLLANGLGAGTAAADDEQEGGSYGSLLDKKFSLALGGFFPAISSTFSLDGDDGSAGGEIDLQDDLGMDEGSASAYVSFNWRFLPRHELQVEWFQLNQDGNTSATRELDIGDTTIFAGASLSSKIDMNLGRLTYGYSILREEKYDLSFLVGAHIATTKVTVSASGLIAIDGGPSFMGTSTESTSTYTFPLPHLGGQFTYEFAPRWAMQFKVMLFALEVNEYRGELIEVNGTVAYQLSKHFGIGTGIKYFNLNLVQKNDVGRAEFDYQFLGPAVFGYATF